MRGDFLSLCPRKFPLSGAKLRSMWVTQKLSHSPNHLWTSSNVVRWCILNIRTFPLGWEPQRSSAKCVLVRPYTIRPVTNRSFTPLTQMHIPTWLNAAGVSGFHIIRLKSRNLFHFFPKAYTWDQTWSTPCPQWTFKRTWGLCTVILADNGSK